VGRDRLERALQDGSAREAFLRWARAQGAKSSWTEEPRFELAPVESVVVAPRGGVLETVRTRDLGMLVQETSRDRSGLVDAGVSLRCRARLGDRVAQGQELARLYLRAEDPLLVERCRACFVVGDTGAAPPLVAERLAPAAR
jgi:thymidine phosphorylase